MQKTKQMAKVLRNCPRKWEQNSLKVGRKKQQQHKLKKKLSKAKNILVNLHQTFDLMAFPFSAEEEFRLDILPKSRRGR